MTLSTPHGISADAKGNINVADRGRIQRFDSDLNLIKEIASLRAPSE